MKPSCLSNLPIPRLCFLAKYKNAAANSDRNTVEFLGIWESVFNQDFNYGEFDGFRPASTFQPK